MQKSFRSLALVALLSVTPSMFAAMTGTDPRPIKGSGNSQAVVVVLSVVASMLGL